MIKHVHTQPYVFDLWELCQVIDENKTVKLYFHVGSQLSNESKDPKFKPSDDAYVVYIKCIILYTSRRYGCPTGHRIISIEEDLWLNRIVSAVVYYFFSECMVE